MLWVPPAAPWGTESNYHDILYPSATVGTAVSFPATANTKSSWVQIDAALARDVCEIEFAAIGTGVNGSNSSTLLDIGIGAAGSETVLIADIPIGFCNSQGSGVPGTIRIPVSIPAGTRVAVRVQSMRSTGSFNVAMAFNNGVQLPGLAYQPSCFDTYGARSASSNGQQISASATTYANGAWVELTAATARDHRGFLLLSQGWGGTVAGAISMLASGWIIELGAGAPGAEVVLGSASIRLSTAEVRQGPWPTWPIWACLPAGTRLVARCRSDLTSGSIDAVAIGIS